MTVVVAFKAVLTRVRGGPPSEEASRRTPAMKAMEERAKTRRTGRRAVLRGNRESMDRSGGEKGRGRCLRNHLFELKMGVYVQTRDGKLVRQSLVKPR